MANIFNEFPSTRITDLNLDWLLKSVKDIEVRVKALEADLDGYINEANRYTDEKNAEVIREVESMNTALKQDINSDFSNFTITINANVAALQRDFDALENSVAGMIAGANRYTDARIAENNEYIIDSIETNLDQIKVINPFTGERSTLQEMIDYLARFHFNDPITVSELVARRKTVNALVALGLTYTQLITNGGTLIPA